MTFEKYLFETMGTGMKYAGLLFGIDATLNHPTDPSLLFIGGGIYLFGHAIRPSTYNALCGPDTESRASDKDSLDELVENPQKPIN